MKLLLTLSRWIDNATERIGRTVYWLVLAAVLISAANATVRKIFNYSSNSFLEIQWYLFSLIFLFCAGYTLKHNEHVRIDIITSRLSARGRAMIDIFGTLVFLLIVQAFSELIKRIAFLKGLVPDPSEKIVTKTAEEELAEEILRARGERALAEEMEGIAVGRVEPK